MKNLENEVAKYRAREEDVNRTVAEKKEREEQALLERDLAQKREEQARKEVGRLLDKRRGF